MMIDALLLLLLLLLYQTYRALFLYLKPVQKRCT